MQNPKEAVKLVLNISRLGSQFMDSFYALEFFDKLLDLLDEQIAVHAAETLIPTVVSYSDLSQQICTYDEEDYELGSSIIEQLLQHAKKTVG